MFFYETKRISVRTDREQIDFDPKRCNATKCYMTHYQNFLALDHIAKFGTIAEMAQARLEIQHCKNKMLFWQRQDHFNADEALRQKALLHKSNRFAA